MKREISFNRELAGRCIEEARRVLDIEAESILNLKNSLNEDFIKVIRLLLECRGRVILSGVGKSGLVARKIASTFSSLGTSAFFVHAVEALHGDLGMITEDDILIAISNSGETEEVLNLIPSVRRIGAVLIALTGNKSSTLAEHADLTLLVNVKEEACHHGLAPTASTTTIMALGDAIAITLSELKDFTTEDFAVFHPGGSLGRRLLTKISDIIELRDINPVVDINTSVKQALFTMTKSRMGSTSIVDDEGILVGIITDGDIRRLLEKSVDFLDKPVSAVMTRDPYTISPDRLATEALKLMEDKEINDLPVVKDKKPVGMINLQDLIRAKIY